MNSLEKLADATRMLAEVRSANDAKKLMTMAAAAEYYARKAKLGAEAITYAHTIKIDAMELMGGYLEKEVGPGHPPKRMVPDGNHTLPEGITKRESMNAQFLHAIAQTARTAFEAVRTGAKSITAARQEVRREAQRKANHDLVERAAGPLEELIPGSYSAIVIDPPWDWGDEGDIDQFGRATPTYATMPLEIIAAQPVTELAAPDAHLYLWITNRSLPKGFRLLDEWGFRYITMLTWCKPSIGMGNYFRGSTEHVLFGVRGSLPLLTRDQGTWFTAPRPGQHSGKPPELYALVERCSPGPWLELFARNPRKGWASWGAEIQ